jgi:hypothetical protein
MNRNMCVNCLNMCALGCMSCCGRYKCNCNESCYRCYQYRNSHTNHDRPNSLIDYRKRYLCLECNRCWKEKHDKYTQAMADSYNRNNNYESMYILTKHEMIDLKKFNKENKTRVKNYENQEIYARCKCGNIPICIGEKFRPPKQNDKKAWNKIKELSDDEKDQLLSSYCPFQSNHKRNTIKYDKNINKSIYDIIIMKYGKN